MIALITSCIKPAEKENKAVKSHLDIDERFKQTVSCINKLSAYPFSAIYLLDNSFDYDYQPLIEQVNAKVIIRHFQQYQFINKGINELQLLLSVLQELPEEEELFKISGRYYPNEDFVCELADGFDFKFKAYEFNLKRGTVSTRAYFVKNKDIYEQFLLACLSEVFCYPKRIVGPRSALDTLNQVIKPQISTEFNTSIEFAAARVLKNKKYKVQFADPIGIKGQIAGFQPVEFIEE